VGATRKRLCRNTACRIWAAYTISSYPVKTGHLVSCILQLPLAELSARLALVPCQIASEAHFEATGNADHMGVFVSWGVLLSGLASRTQAVAEVGQYSQHGAGAEIIISMHVEVSQQVPRSAGEIESLRARHLATLEDELTSERLLVWQISG